MKITKGEKKFLKFEEVKATEASIGDMIQAERMAGKAEGIAFVTALLSQTCMFKMPGDDEFRALPPEELHKMSADDMAILGNSVAPAQEGAGGQ